MNQQQVKVWDPAVRIFHWSLVLCFVTAYLTGEELKDWHSVFGYVVLGLVLFRILWGFVGPKHARFSDFLYRPAAVVDYLKGLTSGRPKHFLGHNPAGGLMVLLLLVTLLGASWSGLMAYGAEGKGPLAGVQPVSLIATAYADEDEEHEEHERREHGEHHGEKLWEEVHEVFVNLMLFLIVLHVAGVIVSGRLHKENLVFAMITGKKQVPENEDKA